jgi:uncharacterized repeat protein (TIGR01451 family)
LSDCLFFNNSANDPLVGYGSGGGALLGANATLIDTIFLSNTANNKGGAIYGFYGITLTHSSFYSNTARFGGGVYEEYMATLVNSEFVGNSALDAGGGLYVPDAVTMTGTTFLRNSTSGGGGGMYAGYVATLTNSSFISNVATYGGGGLSSSGAATLTGTQFISNVAGISGGGAYFGAGSNVSQRRMTNSLLAGNRAGQGDGLFIDLPTRSAVILHTTFADAGFAPHAALYVQAGTVGITNTIFASHSIAINVSGGAVFQDYNLFFGNGADTMGTVGDGGHSLEGDPRFVDPGGNDYHLGIYSPAIDMGANVAVNRDFEGDARPQGTGFDIGFDESPYTSVVDAGVTKSASSSTLERGQSLTYTLVFSNAGPYVATGVQLTDIVPANLISVSYSSSGAALVPNGGNSYVWQVANLPPGAGGMVTITGVLTGTRGGTIFTNTATIATTTAEVNPANNSSAVDVTVTNAPPVAASDLYTISTNSTLTVMAPGLLTNDFDANGDMLTATLESGPTAGSLSLQPDGSFSFTPPLDFAGVVMFTYRASDGTATSNTATTTITVTEVEHKLYLPLLRR